VTGLILVLVMWWLVILCWYVFFGLWLAPYRLFRRGQPKRDVAMLRHRGVPSLDGQPTAGRPYTASAVSLKEKWTAARDRDREQRDT